MPYQVLIADDEQIIREGLSFLVDWDMMDCVIAYRAKDGEEAIDYLKSHPGTIDIIITDIKMPAVDGLGVARYVKEHSQFSQTIILTAYTDFTLAQQAIRYDVSAFVIKNDIAETLPQAIRKAQSAIQVKRQETIKLKTADNLMRKTKEALFETTMRNAVLGLYEPSLEEDGQRYAVITYEIHEPSYAASTALDDQVRSILSFAFLPQRAITAEISRRVFCTMVLGVFRPDGVKELVEKLRDQLAECSLSLIAGVSAVRQRTQELYLATQEALGRLHGISDDQAWFSDQDRMFPITNERNIRDLIKPREQRVFATTLKTFCDAGIPFETLKLELAKVLATLATTYAPFSDGEQDNRYVKELQKAQSRWRLISVLNAYASICLKTNEMQVKTSNPLIREVIAYIHQNYGKQINLQSVARTFHVSDSYLSRLYHKETGGSLVSLLNGRRIDAAKILLDDPTMKIFEISNSVGIPDPTYFSRLFFKHTGMTPTEYRHRTKPENGNKKSQET